MRGDEVLSELNVFDAEFKEKLAQFIEAKIIEAIEDDNRVRDEIRSLASDQFQNETIDADSIDGLQRFIDNNSSLPEVDVDNIYGLERKIKEVVSENMSFEVTVN